MGRIVYTSERSYAGVDIQTLRETDSSLRWEDDGDPSSGPDSISADPADADTLVLAVYSVSGTCFFMQDTAPDRTRYAVMQDADPADCGAANTGSLTFAADW